MSPKHNDAVGVVEGSGSSTPSNKHQSPKTSIHSSQTSEEMPKFKPTLMLQATMSMLGILTLAVALDATALAVALPVR